jgi:predicted component of type VI protein secretion system
MINLKVFGRKRSWPNLNHYPVICLEWLCICRQAEWCLRISRALRTELTLSDEQKTGEFNEVSKRLMFSEQTLYIGLPQAASRACLHNIEPPNVRLLRTLTASRVCVRKEDANWRQRVLLYIVCTLSKALCLAAGMLKLLCEAQLHLAERSLAVKQSHNTPCRGQGGEEVRLLLILELGTIWGWVVSVMSRPRFTPGKRTPVPIG